MGLDVVEKRSLFGAQVRTPTSIQRFPRSDATRKGYARVRTPGTERQGGTHPRVPPGDQASPLLKRPAHPPRGGGTQRSRPEGAFFPSPCRVVALRICPADPHPSRTEMS